jgi:hypothetical protein
LFNFHSAATLLAENTPQDLRFFVVSWMNPLSSAVTKLGPWPCHMHKLPMRDCLQRQLSTWTRGRPCGPIFFGPRLADFERPTAEHFAVQALNGCTAFRIIAHRHECETSGLTCLSIGYDLNFFDASILFEYAVQVGFGHGK